eukprot:3261572-Rhodomonas_salina.2
MRSHYGISGTDVRSRYGICRTKMRIRTGSSGTNVSYGGNPFAVAKRAQTPKESRALQHGAYTATSGEKGRHTRGNGTLKHRGFGVSADRGKWGSDQVGSLAF